MKISFSKNFLKQAGKLSLGVRGKLQQSLRLFVANPLNSGLRNHALRGKYRDYRSIDVTGDVRALYLAREGEAIFDAVGTHSQLYG